MLPNFPEEDRPQRQQTQGSEATGGKRKAPRQRVKPSTLGEQQQRRMAGERQRQDKVGTERWSKT